MKLKIFFPITLTLFLVSLFTTADAQRGQRVLRTRVVKTPRFKVVTVHTRVGRKAHVRYAALPRWGAVVTVVPAGAIAVGAYHFHNGVFYTKRNNGFIIVHPARGIRIRVLPVGYRTLIIGPRTYYYYYGTFYTKVINGDEYEVVDAPEGAIVDALPDGYEVKMVGNNEYYVLDGVYYGEVDAANIDGGIGYKVVKM